jgi:epoxyqueuosine reductase
VPLNRVISDAARENGFAMVGFAAVRRLDERAQFYRDWLDGGGHASMGWLARDPSRRFDPREIDPRIRFVVSLGYPYHSPAPPALDWRKELRGRIAAYALGPDYHDTVLAKARAVASAIVSRASDSMTRVYVDTGPVFEREWAAEARIGWFGKNTTTLNRAHGSYFFLAEIFTDAEVEPSRAPYRDHCGTCTRCLDLCPTKALHEGYVMESRACISYLTIENRGPIPHRFRRKLGNWIFGCDICQEVCPWNAPFEEHIAPELMPRMDELMALDDAGFSRRFSGSAVKRAKRRGLLRNAAVALGNTGNPDAVPILVRALENDPEPLVRSHAAWALGEVGSNAAKRALDRARQRETDDVVYDEIELAMGGAPANACQKSSIIEH